jgi:hypothetical protein
VAILIGEQKLWMANKQYREAPPVWTIGVRRLVTVAYEPKQEGHLYTVRFRKGPDLEQQLSAARQLRHVNLCSIRQIFTTPDGIALVSPYLDLSLRSLNTSPRYPSCDQLATITREVSNIGTK